MSCEDGEEALEYNGHKTLGITNCYDICGSKALRARLCMYEYNI